MEYRDHESQELNLTRFVFDTNSLTSELRVCYLRIVHEAFQIRETTKVFRILLVDDNRNGLLARKSVLQEHGYVVHTCSAPEDALVEFTPQPYDMIVTDYRMPKMTGAELIEQIRITHPSLPIVLISGVVDVLGLDEKTTGANVVIPKSSTEVTHLLRAVKRLLESQAPKKPVRSQSGKASAKKSSANSV